MPERGNWVGLKSPLVERNGISIKGGRRGGEKVMMWKRGVFLAVVSARGNFSFVNREAWDKHPDFWR